MSSSSASGRAGAPAVCRVMPPVRTNGLTTRSFFFRSKFLDRLAGRLQLGLFGRAGDVQLDGDHDLGVQVHLDLVQAQFLDGLTDHDLFAVDRETFLGGDGGCVTGGDRAIQVAAVGGRANHDELLSIELVAQGFGFFLGFQVACFELRFYNASSLAMPASRFWSDLSIMPQQTSIA